MRTLLTTVYAAGLRVSEVVGLQVGDIDSARMTIHVREGKDGRDRHVMLSQGVDIRVIQHLLGHRQITSTTRYARVALSTIRQVKSPLELLDLGGPPPA